MLEVDSSYQPFRAILSQIHDRKRSVLAYVSLTQIPSNRNAKSCLNFELLDVKWATTETSRNYLLGAEVEIYKDRELTF